MSTRVIVPAQWEPIEFNDVKDMLHLDDDSEVNFITGVIREARSELEQSLRRAICQQALESVVEFFMPPSGPISGYIDYTSGKLEVPFPPLVSITNVSMESQPGVWQPCPQGSYYTDVESIPGAIWIQEQAFEVISMPVWTIWTEPFVPRVKIAYTCGYASANEVPDYIIALLKQFIAFKYQNREGGDIPQYLKDSIALYRMISL